MLLAFLFAVAGSGPSVIAGARLQLIRPAVYCPDYFRISYPGGDVPQDKGACVDVIIRALRYDGYDLQALIHRDILRRSRAYPRHEAHVDSNIDHRRVPNQMVFFSRFGQRLTTSLRKPDQWKAGDFVFWKLDSGKDHCGIVSNRMGPRGLPLVIHNIWQTAEEDVLDRWKISGHFRYPVTGAANMPPNRPHSGHRGY